MLGSHASGHRSFCGAGQGRGKGHDLCRGPFGVRDDLSAVMSGLGGGQGPSPIIGRSAIETAEGDKQLPDLLERACAPVGSSRLEKQPRVVVYACAISDSIAGRASIIRWNTAPPGLTASPARSR